MGKFPDRWEVYTPIGKTIKGTRFIAFKVPLKQYLFANQSKCESLTTHDIMNKIPSLGLVIDLTNTAKYYHPQDFTNAGVEHLKLFCKGREIPSKDIINKFSSTVKKYLENNPDALVGVHCTHGLNRTGYLVCRYMIENMGFSPQEAITNFEDARGHEMEREIYLDDLKIRRSSPRKSPKKSQTLQTKDSLNGAQKESSPKIENLKIHPSPKKTHNKSSYVSSQKKPIPQDYSSRNHTFQQRDYQNYQHDNNPQNYRNSRNHIPPQQRDYQYYEPQHHIRYPDSQYPWNNYHNDSYDYSKDSYESYASPANPRSSIQRNNYDYDQRQRTPYSRYNSGHQNYSHPRSNYRQYNERGNYSKNSTYRPRNYVPGNNPS